ncbi:MAG: helix-turn-helix domain-containing protein, partial [Actinobacteria bacterium]|nr:helix-turn-helix domain-containing protein [Actinomycetota bacterium]
HPQTVRYRLGRLRDLFGDALDEPDSRFALTLATQPDPGPPSVASGQAAAGVAGSRPGDPPGPAGSPPDVSPAAAG